MRSLRSLAAACTLAACVPALASLPGSLLVGGCGDVVEPPADAQLAGTWTGTTKTVTVAAADNCAAAPYRALLGQTGPLTLAITQQGQAVSSATLTGGLAHACQMNGTVSQQTLTLRAQVCVVTGTDTIRCGDGPRATALSGVSLLAELRSGQLVGLATYTFDTRDSLAGTGTMAVEESLLLTRS